MRIVLLRANKAIPDSRVEKECAALSKAGHEVTVVMWNREKAGELTETAYAFAPHVESRMVAISIPAAYASGFRRLLVPMLHYGMTLMKWLLKHEREYDAIHACDLDTAVFSWPVAKGKKKRFIYDVFDYYCDNHRLPSAVRPVIRKIDTAILNSSDCVILCSEMRVRQIEPAHPKKIAVIHNSPPDMPGAQSGGALPGADGKVRIVYMGSLVKDRFIVEMIETIGAREDCELHIGGFGPIQEQIERMAAQYPNVHWYGEVKYGRVLEIEAACDVMTALYSPAMDNHRYAAPNKFYESLMLKKPLMMMRDTGMDSYVEEYGLGEVIDGGAQTFKEGFSRALDRLIARRDQWKEMGERGYRLYEQQFSWDEMEKRLLKVYEELPR